MRWQSARDLASARRLHFVAGERSSARQAKSDCVTISMMTAERGHTRQTMTLKQWGELPEDVDAELVDGVLVEDEMTSEVHDTVLGFLYKLFSNWVDPRGGYVFFDRKYAVGRQTGRKPDVSVFLPGTKGLTGAASVTMAPADIVIEVITPTARDIRRDRVEKRREYARFGVRWYWLVDPSLRTVEILELSPKGRYEHVLDGTRGKLRVPGCRGLVLDLDELWRRQERLSGAPRSSRRARG